MRACQTDVASSAGTSCSCSTPAETSGRTPVSRSPCSMPAQQPSTPQTRQHTQTSSRSTAPSWSTTAWVTLLTLALLHTPCSGRTLHAKLLSPAQVLDGYKFAEVFQRVPGLWQELSDPSWTGTIFVPETSGQEVNTNRLATDLLNVVINYHISKPKGYARSGVNRLTHRMALPTAAGQTLYVDRNTQPGTIIIRGFGSAAKILRSIKVPGNPNACIHVVDNVLYPNTGAVAGCQSTMELIMGQRSRMDFYKLVAFAGMADALNSLNGILLVPSNAALTLKKQSAEQAKKAVQRYMITSSGVLTQYSMTPGMVLTAEDGTQMSVNRQNGNLILRRKGRSIPLKPSGALFACQASKTTAAIFFIDVNLG